MTYKQIARELFISPSTVRSHLHNVLTLVEAPNAAQGFIRCLQRGWVEVEGLTSERNEFLARVAATLDELVEAIHDRRERTPLTADARMLLRTFNSYLEIRSKNDELADHMLVSMRENVEFVVKNANMQKGGGDAGRMQRTVANA
jgi:predicted ArsR family transcriptional regulator